MVEYIGNIFEVKIIFVYFNDYYQSFQDEYSYYMCITSRATDLYIWCIVYLYSDIHQIKNQIYRFQL